MEPIDETQLLRSGVIAALNENTKAIERQRKIIKYCLMVGGSIAGAFFILCCYVLGLMMKYHIPTNLAMIIGGCQ